MSTVFVEFYLMTQSGGVGGDVAASVQLVYCGRFIEVPVRARQNEWIVYKH